MGGDGGGMDVKHTVTQTSVFANCIKCCLGIRGL